MNASDYRPDFSAFCSALERARYRRHAGLTDDRRETTRARETYAHFFRRDEIESLRRALADTSEGVSTEREGLRALICAAALQHVAGRSAELREELSRCEASGAKGFAPDPASPPHLLDVPSLIALEADGARRRELTARWFDALRPCDDLRATLLASQSDAARELGFDDLHALLEQVNDSSYATHAAAAQTFLRATSQKYRAQLARWAARELPHERAPHYADALFFRRSTHLDQIFPATQLSAARVAALDALGNLGVLDAWRRNVSVDEATRSSKRAHTRCFAPGPPDEVIVCVGARESGAALLRNFFAGAGRALFHAWTSRDLAARYPEFVHAADTAARDGYGLLLRRLFADPGWVAEHRALRESEAREAARACALVELYDARLCAARLQHALALRDAPDSTQTADGCAATHEEATGFRHDVATSLHDAAPALGALTRWRATLFAAALEEHLRRRHGRRWWASRRAGDELIDMWNTAGRYPVEELARLVGAGELSAELLAEGLNAAAGEAT